MEQESECLKKMKNGDLEARNELIERNMRLVAHVAKKYQSPEDEMEDLISIGTIGLIKAVETYKEDYGSRLATYAARCIDNELLMHFRAKKKTSKEVSLYEPIGTDKEGNQIQLLDVVVSEDEDVVELLEQDRKVRRLNEIIPQNVMQTKEEFPGTAREIVAIGMISRNRGKIMGESDGSIETCCCADNSCCG